MANTDPTIFEMLDMDSSENPAGPERRFDRGSVTLTWEAPAGGETSATAQVEDISEDRIVVRLDEAIIVGQTVRVKDDQAERKATVQHCEKQGDGFLAILYFIAYDRRRADRLPASGGGTLRWRDRSGGQVARVQVRNVNDSGVQIEIHKRLEPGQAVWLSGDAWECEGHVRYCRRSGASYLAGVQLIRPPYPKNSADYRM